MNREQLRTIVFVILGSILMTVPISAAQITIRSLPFLEGSDYATAIDINDKGLVVGESTFVVDQNYVINATYWDINTNSVTDLGKGDAYAINNKNQAAGMVEGGIEWTAGLWNLPDKTPIKMQASRLAGANDINENGIIVGSIEFQPFMWNTNDNNLVPTILSPYTGYDLSIAYEINDNNQIVGYSYISETNNIIATYWNASQSTINPVILNPYSGTTISTAFSVNNYGKAVGISANPYSSYIPTLWDINTGEVSVLNSPTASSCTAIDINDLGQIVGFCESPLSVKGVLWDSPTSDPIILPGDDKVYPRAINNVGQIAGYTVNETTGKYTPILWTIEILTPSEEIQQIITDVNNLVNSGELNKGEGNSLNAKLLAAEYILEKDNKAAINELDAFINEIKGLVNSGRLSSKEGQNLIDAANNIISNI